MRLAIASFAHESITFSSKPTTLDDFEVFEGEQIISYHIFSKQCI